MSPDITIAIASDHGALDLKNHLRDILSQNNHVTIDDKGTHDENSVDYPDIAKTVVNDILDKKADLGILCCGTGIGISMKANRYKGIRAALVYDDFTAKMAKAHNNANILCLGGRTTDPKIAEQLVNTWLNTSFEEGRHQNRLDKLDQ